jgi:hypothetical protein
MRKTILAAIAASALTGAAAGSFVQLASAQQTPSGPPAAAPSGETMEQNPGPGWRRGMHWRQRMREMGMREPGMGEMRHGRFAGHGTFALFYQQADRQLSAADVQKIAEAFLLWHGNHSWKVVDVAESPDNTVGFGYAASDGTVIAKFAMDRKTGRITRVG